MENYTLYFHNPDFEGIVSIIKHAFPNGKFTEGNEDGSQILNASTKGGLFSRKESLSVKYRQRANPSYNLLGDECPVLNQVRGLFQFVSSLDAADENLKNLLLAKIQTLNAEASFIFEPTLTDAFTNMLRSIADSYEAIIFSQPGSTLGKSVHQHFLDKDFNLLIDTQGNCGDGKIVVTINAQFAGDQQPPTPEQLHRKEASEKMLAENGIATNPHLPCTTSLEETVLKSKEEIIERAYALALIAAKGEGVPKASLEKVKQSLPINDLSPEEKIIYEKPELDDQEKVDSIWRYESLNVLMWAMGFLETLPYPSQICDVPAIVGPILNHSRQEFHDRAAVRSTEEILNEKDLVYRMNWACVNARLSGLEPGGGLNPSVVYERHYALNWLCTRRGDDTQWDDISTDT